MTSQVAEKPKKLPARVRRVIDTCRAGQRLCVYHRTKASGETETMYFFEPSGKSVPPTSAKQAIETPLLRPMGDALFDWSISQAFEAAE